MNEAFYRKVSTTAAKAMTNYATAGKLVRKPKGLNPATGRPYAATATIETDCQVVFSSHKTRTTDGLIVNQSIATLTVEPQVGDQIVGGIKTETVAEVEVIAPVGQPIIWRAVLK